MSIEFQSAAQQIIKDSIKSSIYIDDDCYSPIDAEWNGYTRGKNLYGSLIENKCSIEFLRYTSNMGSEINFSHKDLIILDWKLNGEDTSYKLSYSILDKIVNQKNIHFCCIYTNEDQERNGPIISEIYAHFSGLDKGDLNLDTIYGFLDENEYDRSEQLNIVDQLKSLSHEYLLNSSSSQKKSDIKKKLIDEVFNKEYKKFLALITLLEPAYNSVEKDQAEMLAHRALIKLCFIVNEWKTKQQTKTYKTYFAFSGNLLIIDNLILFVLPKGEANSDTDFYEKFSSAVSGSTNVFLTLFGLEMKNKFLQMPSFISDELAEVSEEAFIFHRTHKGEFFNDFLREIWRDHSTTFLLNNSNLSTIANLENYIASSDELKKRIGSFNKSNPKNVTELSSLNLIYNRNNIIKPEGQLIGFGDVFSVRFVKENQQEKELFGICLTPLCDCLLPKKSNFNYYFVFGERFELGKALDKAEGDYLTYLKKENDLIAIRWILDDEKSPKPFTLYIDDPLLNENLSVRSFYCCKPIELGYIGTVKENYTQRIANFAFNYPLRVGIDFASFKD